MIGYLLPSWGWMLGAEIWAWTHGAPIGAMVAGVVLLAAGLVVTVCVAKKDLS